MHRDDQHLFARGARLVAAYVRMHPRPFLIAVGAAFVFAGASVAVSVALGRVTDRVLRPAFEGGVDAGTVWLGVLAIMLLAGLRAGSIMVRRYQSGVAGAAVAASLRRRVSDRYRDLSLSFHRATPAGELLAHMEADVEAAVDVYYPVPFAVAASLLTVFAIGSLVAADPFLAAIGLVAVPALVLLNRSFARRMQPLAERTLDDVTRLSSIAHESVDGALIVKTLGREAAEIDRLRGRAEHLRLARVAAGHLRASFEPALTALPSLIVILMLAVGSWRVSTGSITLGTLVQVVTLFGLLAWPMRFVGWILSELPRAVTGYGRIERVLEQPVRVRPPDHPLPLPDGPLGVAAERVSYAFDGSPVLDDVSLEIRPNESVALVGPTGVGKSTLSQLLVRLDDPSAGVVRIGGVDLREVEPMALRSAVSIVFQESFLFATSIRDNITLDAGATPEEVERVATVTHADGFIRELPRGYETIVGERGHTLSGGERQRIALARALLRRPRVLILDDATSAVDPSIEASILAALREEVRTTLIVVAYRLATIRLADRVLYLEDGRIRATGTHQEVLERRTRIRGDDPRVRARRRTSAMIADRSGPRRGPADPRAPAFGASRACARTPREPGAQTRARAHGRRLPRRDGRGTDRPDPDPADLRPRLHRRLPGRVRLLPLRGCVRAGHRRVHGRARRRTPDGGRLRAGADDASGADVRAHPRPVARRAVARAPRRLRRPCDGGRRHPLEVHRVGSDPLDRRDRSDLRSARVDARVLVAAHHPGRPARRSAARDRPEDAGRTLLRLRPRAHQCRTDALRGLRERDGGRSGTRLRARGSHRHAGEALDRSALPGSGRRALPYGDIVPAGRAVLGLVALGRGAGGRDVRPGVGTHVRPGRGLPVPRGPVPAPVHRPARDLFADPDRDRGLAQDPRGPRSADRDRRARTRPRAAGRACRPSGSRA